MQFLLLALTTQWGADESVPSRPFPSPRHHIPSLTHCTDFRKKFSGDSPPTPNNNMPTQKYISHGAVMAGLSFSVPLRSCRAVTVMGRTVTPDKGRDNHHSRPLIGLVWPEKTLMGQSRVGGAAQRSQCLLGNHSDCLSLPKVPNNTPPTTPSFFFLPFIGCSQASILGEGDWLLHKSLILILEGAFLLTDWKKCKVKEHLHTNSLTKTFCLPSKPSYPSFHSRLCCLT